MNSMSLSTSREPPRRAARIVVEHAHGMAVRDQRLHQRRADEAAAAGDEDARTAHAGCLAAQCRSAAPCYASGARHRAAPAHDSLRQSPASPAGAVRSRRESGGQPRHRRNAAVRGKLPVERIVLDRDGRERRGRAAAVAQRRSRAYSRRSDCSAPACRPRRRIPADGRCRDRMRNSWRSCRRRRTGRQASSATLVSNDGSSGRPESRADKSGDRPAEPFEIMKQWLPKFPSAPPPSSPLVFQFFSRSRVDAVLDVPIDGDMPQPPDRAAIQQRLRLSPRHDLE